MSNLPVNRYNIFLGPSGSGKTELSINFALKTRSLEKRKVCFFDMDQTKGVFRSRDFFSLMSDYGIETVETFDFQDAPIVPSGITSKLNDEDIICVFDVGGNASGATMIGQYSEYFTSEASEVFFVINPCRPFTDSVADITQSMQDILRASGMEFAKIKILSNPNMGNETTAKLIIEKQEKLEIVLRQMGICQTIVCVKQELYKRVKKEVNAPAFSMELFVESLY